MMMRDGGAAADADWIRSVRVMQLMVDTAVVASSMIHRGGMRVNRDDKVRHVLMTPLCV